MKKDSSQGGVRTPCTLPLDPPLDIILARAGLFDLSASKVKEMTVSGPKHRNNLGRYWQSPRNCQYPKHAGKFKKIEEGIVINFKASREIYTLFGKTAQVGSRKYKIYYLKV